MFNYQVFHSMIAEYIDGYVTEIISNGIPSLEVIQVQKKVYY
jgi:hypothetical protein